MHQNCVVHWRQLRYRPTIRGSLLHLLFNSLTLEYTRFLCIASVESKVFERRIILLNRILNQRIKQLFEGHNLYVSALCSQKAGTNHVHSPASEFMSRLSACCGLTD